MKGSTLRVLVALVAAGCWSSTAFASTIPIGFLSFDDLGGMSTFLITNLTGPNAAPPDYPVTPLLTIGVTSLTVNVSSGGPFVLNSSVFTTDSSGNVK